VANTAEHPDLHARLRTARRRLVNAQRREYAARCVIEVESRRITAIEARISAIAAGHVLTSDPDPANRYAKSTFCRLCRVAASSIAGGQPCPGDQRRCHFDVAEGESPTGFQMYRRPGWLCGQPGGFDTTFSTWTCTAGHDTTRDGPCWSGVCLPECPWPGLATVCP
jgi:hypothetical protein